MARHRRSSAPGSCRSSAVVSLTLASRSPRRA